MKSPHKPAQSDLFAPRLPKYENLAEPVKRQLIASLAGLLTAARTHAKDALARRKTDAE